MFESLKRRFKTFHSSLAWNINSFAILTGIVIWNECKTIRFYVQRNTTISFSFLSMHHKNTKKIHAKRWSKIFGKHENLLSRINFFSFLPKMLSTRFMPQILCVLQRETTFQGKLPQKSFIMQLKFSFTIFRVLFSIQRKWREIYFD